MRGIQDLQELTLLKNEALVVGHSGATVHFSHIDFESLSGEHKENMLKDFEKRNAMQHMVTSSLSSSQSDSDGDSMLDDVFGKCKCLVDGGSLQSLR